MEKPCPVCSHALHKCIYHDPSRDLRIVRCSSCGFRFQNPPPKMQVDKENTEMYYQKTYLDVAESHRDLFLEKIDTFLADIHPGKALDIGCATGQFLEAAKKRGWTPYGIDVSQWCCNYLKNKGFANIIHGDLSTANFPDQFFDLVHLSHVLEHVPDLPGFLNEIYRIMRPGGRVMIEVPNETLFPWNYKLINLFHSEKKKRKTPRNHISLFSKKTLALSLQKSGFRLILIREEGFYSNHRRATAVFQQKNLFMRLLVAGFRLRLDERTGLARYITALAQKP